MVSLEAFSELLQVLYSAPLEQEQWQHFLTLLSKYTDSRFGLFFFASSRSGLSVVAQGGGSRFSDLLYNEQYAANDPFRHAALRNPRLGVIQGEELLPDEGLLRTDVYRDVLAPLGVRYATMVHLTLTVRRVEVITLWRGIDQVPMDEDRVRLLNLLFPHIQQALEIRQVLGITKQRLASAEAMVDASATATFLLTRQGRVLRSNVAADLLLQQSDTLAVKDGTLITKQAHFKESLRKLFADAALSISPQLKANPAHALALPQGFGKQPLQLLASPLPPGHRTRCNADLILLVTDPEKPLNLPDEVLHALYGLTPAQTEVANGLLTGFTVEEIARLRRVSAGTVRQQLKDILSKTGTSRQSELVRLLMNLPAASNTN